MENSKYELMLKRLLAQQNIERKGPKRRETIRLNNNNNLINLIHEVIEDNKNKKYNNPKEEEENKNKTNNLQKRESILINFKDKNNALSLTYGKHSVIITNKYSQKKIAENIEDTEINGGNITNEINPTSYNNSKSNNDD